ncbi:MAG: hypothetical protein U0W40_14910 [Acidimicrobiia bacterium]
MSGAQTKIGIVEWSGRIRSGRSIEMRLSATLGTWVPRVEEPAAKILLARHARHFAWHADLWDALVPVLHDVVVPDGVSDPLLMEAVAALNEATQPLAVYDDVLPHLVAAYRDWASEASPVAERPIMRTLDLALRDVDFDAQEGHDHFS